MSAATIFLYLAGDAVNHSRHCFFRAETLGTTVLSTACSQSLELIGASVSMGNHMPIMPLDRTSQKVDHVTIYCSSEDSNTWELF